MAVTIFVPLVVFSSLLTTSVLARSLSSSVITVTSAKALINKHVVLTFIVQFFQVWQCSNDM